MLVFSQPNPFRRLPPNRASSVAHQRKSIQQEFQGEESLAALLECCFITAALQLGQQTFASWIWLTAQSRLGDGRRGVFL
jgi:hypothetical protein